jgi:hypothetical protein
MKVIVPMTVSDTTLSTSNVTENDYSAWSGATAYVVGNRVILTTGYHQIFECIANNTNKHPVTDAAAATYWVEVSATNRWKAFDGKINDHTTRASSISYTFAPDMIVDRIAFFGLLASSIDIVVKDSMAATVYSATIDLVDRTDSVTWFSWLLDPIQYDTEALSIAIPGYVGNTVQVTINSSGTAEVGQIVIGRTQSLGTPLVGTEVGFDDYSLIERDEFGSPTIVERSYTDTVQFQFTFPMEDARRVKRIVVSLRARPAVFFTDEVDISLGTLVYGIHKGFSVPLQLGASFASLEVEGLA